MDGGSSSFIGVGAVGIGVGVGAVGSPFDSSPFDFESSCGAMSSVAMSSSSMVTLAATADSFCSSSLLLAAQRLDSPIAPIFWPTTQVMVP